MAGAIVLLAGVLVAQTLDRPTPPAYSPSPPRPVSTGERLVGPVTYTVDARNADDWQHFDFSRGSVIERPNGRNWDLAFRRFDIIANGGNAFAGDAGILNMGAIPFDSLRRVPETGYRVTTADSDSVNPATSDWYDYGFTSHLLTPKPRTYAVRTADGRYAKIEILSYYCTGARSGCLTFRYVYQGDGSPAVDAGAGG